MKPAAGMMPAFHHGAMNDRIGHGGAEKGSLEFSCFREIVGPFAASEEKRGRRSST
jgi:hypothetical protein